MNVQEASNKKHRSTGLMKGLLGILFVCVVTLAGMEVLVRIFDPIGIRYFIETNRYFRNMTPDDAFGYIHTPHYQATLQGVDVTINSHGLRGPEFDTDKRSGRTRLMILGDSVVFGWGVSQETIFPTRLQHMFDRDDRDIEVIAAGVGSWNTRTEFEFLRTRGVHYGPDVVLLVIVDNDVESKLLAREGAGGDLQVRGEKKNKKPVRRFIGPIWRWSAARFYLVGYIQYFRRIGSTKQQYSTFNENSPEWQDAKLALDGIVDTCRHRDIALVVCLYSSEERIEEDAILSLYRGAVMSKDIPMFVLPEALFSDPSYRNSVVDGHANERGQELIGREVYGQLKALFEELETAN